MTKESRTENGATLESSYVYDALGQLTEFTRSDGYAESYTYDGVGNMLSKTQNGTTTRYSYNAANQLISSAANGETTKYTYDANGNLVQKGNTRYTYNALNLLESWTDGEYSESYSYNAEGLLSSISNAEGTTNLTWDILMGEGVVISAETNGVETYYTYGLERISAQTGKTRTEYVYDGRGSVAAEVSYNNAWYTLGGILSSKEAISKSYTPFGEQIGEAISGFGYNGEYYSAATGMVYLRARFYEPEMNRFSQKDVVRGSIVQPGSLNRYSYVQNDPVNFIDPSGMALGYTGSSRANLQRNVSSTSSAAYVSMNSPVSTSTKSYGSTYQEYMSQVQASRTPSPKEYSQLRQSGVSMSYGEYSYYKSQTRMPSYEQYVYDKSVGRPVYNTYGPLQAVTGHYVTAYPRTPSYTVFTSPGISAPVEQMEYYCDVANRVPDIQALGAGDYGSSKISVEGMKTSAVILWETVKYLGQSLDGSIGIGLGLGGTGKVSIYGYKFGAALQYSGTSIELNLDDGKAWFGRSITAEAYLDLIFGQVGFADKEVDKFDQNWIKDESGSFKIAKWSDTIGFDFAAYLIIGISFEFGISLEDLYYDFPEYAEKVKEIIYEK